MLPSLHTPQLAQLAACSAALRARLARSPGSSGAARCSSQSAALATCSVMFLSKARAQGWAKYCRGGAVTADRWG